MNRFDKPDNRPDEDYDEEQLQQGIKVELEHTKNKRIAKMIAKDHLDEIPDYYKKLKTIEQAHESFDHKLSRIFNRFLCP